MVIGPEECVGKAATGTALVIGIVATVGTLLAVEIVVTIAADNVARVATAIERALGAVLMVEAVEVAKRVLVAVGERPLDRNHRPNRRRKSVKNDRGKQPEARMRTVGRT